MRFFSQPGNWVFLSSSDCFDMIFVLRWLSQLWYSWDMNAVFAESLEHLLKQCYKNCECDFLLTSTRYLEVLMWDALVFTNSHPG